MDIDALTPISILHGLGQLRPPDSPLALDVQPSALPPEILSLDQWVAWDWVRHHGSSWRKVPVSPLSGTYCNDASPQHACSFDRALAYSRRMGLPGIGLILTERDGVIALDIDDCADASTGAVDATIWRKVRQLHSYTEYSPTGTGLRVLVRDGSPHTRGTTEVGPVEVFASNCFVTITGHHVNGTPHEIAGVPLSSIVNLFNDGATPPRRQSGWFHETPEPPIRILDSCEGNVLVDRGGNIELWPLQFHGSPTLSSRYAMSASAEKGVIGDGCIVYCRYGSCEAIDLSTGVPRWDVMRAGTVLSLSAPRGWPLLISSRYELWAEDEFGLSEDFWAKEIDPTNCAWRLVDQTSGRVIEQERGYVAGEVGLPPHSIEKSEYPNGLFVVVSETLHETIIEAHDRRTGAPLWSAATARASEIAHIKLSWPYLGVSTYSPDYLQFFDVRTGEARAAAWWSHPGSWEFVPGGGLITPRGDHLIERRSIVSGGVEWSSWMPSGYRLVDASLRHVTLAAEYGVYPGSPMILNADTGEPVLDCEGALLHLSSTHAWLLTPDPAIVVIDLRYPDCARGVRLPDDTALLPTVPDGLYGPEDALQIVPLDETFLLSNGMMVLQYPL